MGNIKDYLLNKIYDAILPFEDISDITDDECDDLMARDEHHCMYCNSQFSEVLDLLEHLKESHKK